MKIGRVLRSLGSILKVFAIFFLVPAIGSLYWDDDVGLSPLSEKLPFALKETTVGFALTALFVMLFGVLLTTSTPSYAEDLREREAYVAVALAWILCALVGAIPFLLIHATTSPFVAFYEAMSGLTTTGYSALPLPLEKYPESVHLWRGTMHFFGGLGIIVVLYTIVGRLTEGATKLMMPEAGGDVTRLRPKLSQTTKALFGIYTGLVLLFFLALTFALHESGLSWKASSYHGIVHSMGSIATGGMSTQTLSVEAFQSVAVNVIIYLAMFAGSLSFVLYYFVLTGHGIGRLFRDSQFLFYVAVIFGATLVVSAFLYEAGWSLWSALGHGAFMALTAAATCGYTTTDATAFPDGAKLVLLLLMITGGMVGSTAGAIKVARIQRLFQLTFREIQRLLHPHAVSIVKVGGRIVPEETMRRIVVFFFTYVTVFIAGSFAFAFLGYGMADSLVASAASLGGVGFGWGDGSGFADPASPLAPVVSMVLMWLGRLEIFAALVLFIPSTYKG